ncbi:MAG: response regulator [Blastocatellia bacterium]
MPSTKCPFLLIGEQGDFWRQVLEGALAPMGHLQTVEEKSAIDLVIENEYAAIVIDAAHVGSFGLMTSRIRAQRPDARVIVATAAPSWQRAREAFKSGATDYIYKSADEAELLASLEAALAKPLTPWP